MRVLIIDDNPYDAELVRLELKRNGQFDFDHAENYAEFKEYYSNRKYTAILSDYHLPGTSTIDILKEVRADDMLIPFIFITGTVGEEQAVELLKIGATDYVLKNNLNKLQLALKRAIKEMEITLAEKDASEAVRANAAFRLSVFSAIPANVGVINKKGELIFVNQNWINFSAESGGGTSEADYLGVNYLKVCKKTIITGDKSAIPAFEGIKKILSGSQDYFEVEYPCHLPDTERWFIMKVSPFYSEEGGAVIVHTNISESKKNKEFIKRNNELLRDAQHIAKIGSWEWNVSNNKMLYSDEIFNVLGIKPREEEINFELTFKYVHPDDRERVKEMIEQFKNKSAEIAPVLYRIITPAGELKFVETKAKHIFDEKGNITALLGTIQDLSEIIKAEEEKQMLQAKAMELLEEKVIERTEELSLMNYELELRNHEITDSINYAKNIQRSILAKTEDCRRTFPDSSVLWLPKAIVSGDFYWCYSKGNYDFIAVVDCTGHGVPGALMSIIANQMLTRVVSTYGFVEPKDILFHLDDAIVTSLKQETGLVKDGMDIAIVRVDKKNNTLIFAGAQRPLYYYDGKKLNEIQGSKNGIGGFFNGGEYKAFPQTEIKYKKRDCFYLTTDGYYSQFGGEKGKKMMKKRMREYISTIVDQSTAVQKKMLFNYLTQWQGEEEQTDDILVIGMRM